MNIDFAKLQRAFNPQCIAVIGDKKEFNFMWLRSLSTFKGSLYSVQIDPKEIAFIKELEVRNFTCLLDIPETIDLVILAVPRIVTPKILEDCIQKKVAAVHLFTSGFAETDTDEGKRLQHHLALRANQTNLHLIGPNCMGIFNPKLGVRQSPEQYTGISGPVGFISQSGTHAVTFSIEGHLQGIDINKSVSFGNGIVLDSTDYLNYFGNDMNIKAIGMYLEGIKDSKRFLDALKKVSAKKPVVIWKGGQTEEGGRAIASHTGSMALPEIIWDAAIKQSGAIGVANLEELIDTLKALILLPPVSGKRIALAGGSGGQSVAITDAFAKIGLKIPLLTQESYDKLEIFFNLVGASCRNPIDPGANRKDLGRIMEILAQDTHIDNLVLVLWPMASQHISKRIEKEIQLLIDLKKSTSKPIIAIVPTFSSPENLQQVRAIAQSLQNEYIPTYFTAEQGARALKNAFEYYKFKNNLNTNQNHH